MVEEQNENIGRGFIVVVDLAWFGMVGLVSGWAAWLLALQDLALALEF